MQWGFVQNVRGLFAIKRDDHSVQVVLIVNRVTKRAKRKLTTGAEGAQYGAFGGHGVFGSSAVEHTDSGEDRGIACGVFGVERVLRAASFKRERSLPWRWRNFIHGKTLVHMLRALKAIEASGGKDESVALARLPFAQAGINIAAQLDKFEVGA